MNQANHKTSLMHSFQFLTETVRIHKMSIHNSGRTNGPFGQIKKHFLAVRVFLVVFIHHSPPLATLRLSVFLVYTSSKG